MARSGPERRKVMSTLGSSMVYLSLLSSKFPVNPSGSPDFDPDFTFFPTGVS